ncbi:hypothetical protein AB0F17_26765 [Nonomuraea sp. NPDC026600]|uniref:hypothetical protein n=1 Tax=Nonomuraea sp. NPDC026600 TaxID=3155363 RepID=UPI0033C809E0
MSRHPCASSLDTQTDALKVTDITRVFAKKISTRATVRPERRMSRFLDGGHPGATVTQP